MFSIGYECIDNTIQRTAEDFESLYFGWKIANSIKNNATLEEDTCGPLDVGDESPRDIYGWKI